MLDSKEYNTGDNGHQGNGNGYDHLEGDWALYYKVARGFTHRVKPEDRGDFLHDLMLTMAKVKAKYELLDRPLSEAGLIRVACYEVADYWRKWFKRANGVDCSHCGKAQRQKCREQDLRRECPKVIKTDSLDRVIEDGNGDRTELHELIADDNAVDLVARLDARLILKGYPHKFVRIAYKKYCGWPLDEPERRYFSRQRQKAIKAQQKVLI